VWPETLKSPSSKNSLASASPVAGPEGYTAKPNFKHCNFLLPYCESKCFLNCCPHASQDRKLSGRERIGKRKRKRLPTLPLTIARTGLLPRIPQQFQVLAFSRDGHTAGHPT
jgi:hypothetical protein